MSHDRGAVAGPWRPGQTMGSASSINATSCPAFGVEGWGRVGGVGGVGGGRVGGGAPAEMKMMRV